MQTMTFTEYTLPAHWASALINGDHSGMTDEEQREIECWLASGDYGWCVDVKGEPEFTPWHDARPDVLPCDCLTFTFQTN